MAVKTVKVTINGTEYTLTFNSSTGKYEATLTAPSSSSYPQSGHFFPVSISAEDTAGNIATADATHSTLGESLRLFVKEQIKPTIQITSPSNSAYITNGKPEIIFKLLDNTNGQTSGFAGIDLSTCVVKITNGGKTTVLSSVISSPVAGGHECSVTPTEALSDGPCTVTIDVKDYDGNAAETATCTFAVDTVAPTLTLDAPEDGFETNRNSLTVSGVTDDATSKPITIKIALNGADQGAVTVAADGRFSKDITNFEQGENTVVVTATDLAGKVTTITRTFIYNTVAPVIKSVTISPNPVYAGQTYVISVEVE